MGSTQKAEDMSGEVCEEVEAWGKDVDRYISRTLPNLSKIINLKTRHF